MVRFWGLIAAAISLTSVVAEQPNVGYYAEIDPNEVRVDGGPNSDIIYIDAPVSLTLLPGAPEGSYSLIVTVAPYRIIDESYGRSIDETVVYTGSITAGSPVFVSFEVEKKDWMDFIIEASVQSDEDETIIGQAGDTIIAPDETGYWGAIDLGVWVDRINDELIKELDELPIEFVDEPVDPIDGEEPVRTNPDPKPVRPKEDAPAGNETITSPTTPPTTTPGGGNGSVTGPGGSDGGSITGPGGSDGGSVTRPGPSDGSSGTVTRPSDGNGGGWSTSCQGCGHGSGPRTLITIRKTTTVCPTPTPPPPPCPENEKELAARQQAPIFEAYIKGKIQFMNRQKNILPLRGVRVEAVVDVYSGNKFLRKQKSAARTSLKGEGTFRFTIRENERVEVKRLITILEVAGRWKIGTTKNEATFTTRKIQLTLNKNPWSVNAGGLKSYTNTHSFSNEYRALWVADTIKVITDYALQEVFVPGEQKLVNILYPSTIKKGAVLAGAFFRGQKANSFINLPNMQAFNPSVLGHEYGHYVQYNTRDEKTMAGQSKDPHYLCNTGKRNPSIELSFKEGFASAFGLMALDQSHLEEGYLIARQGTTVTKLGRGVSFEDYKCSDQILLNNEGRVGAALLDLVDRKLDKFDTMTTDKGFIRSGFRDNNLNTRFDPRYIFYLNMRYPPLGAFPDTMRDYWYNLQKSLLDEGDKTSEFKAWSIMEYNFGDEDHDGFPRNKKK